MIRFRVKELLQDRSYKEGRRITMGEVAEATGIHRTTLTKLSNPEGYNATVEIIDKLCSFFGVPVSEVVVHIPDAPTKEHGRVPSEPASSGQSSEAD